MLLLMYAQPTLFEATDEMHDLLINMFTNVRKATAKHIIFCHRSTTTNTTTMRCVKLESITAHLTHMNHAYTYHMRISTTMCVCLCMLCNKAADCDSTACDNRRCHCHPCLPLQPFSLLPPMLLPAAASNYCRCLPSSAFPHASEHYHAHGHWTLDYAPNIFLHNCAKSGDMPCRRSSCLLFACHVGTSMVSMSTESKQLSPAKQHTMDKSSGRG